MVKIDMYKQVIRTEVKIEKLIPRGFGLGTMKDGKKCLLLNSLPDELVTEFSITKNKSSYCEGIANKIDAISPYRVLPQDDCFISTSPWQILDFNYELLLKQKLVVEIFKEHGILIDTPDIKTDGQEYFYRNKMEYSLYFDKEKKKIFPAFHLRGTHKKIPAKKTSLERPEIFKYALNVIEDLNIRGEDARKYQALMLRCDQNGEISGGLFENGQSHPAFPVLSDNLLGQKYFYSPNGFFQINLPVYEMALRKIKNQIETDRVLDLYSGVGTIGLSAAFEKDLILIENDRTAYKELEQNVRNAKNQSRDLKIQTFLIKSEEALDLIEKDQTVILDPPRAGCDTKLIKRLLEAKPEKVIYLSCNPVTQARDIKSLLDTYKIRNMTVYNFFPRTPHIENLVILTK